MNRTAAILGAAIVAAGIMAANLWQQLREGREQLAALRGEVSQLDQAQMAGALMRSMVPESPPVQPAPR